MGDVHIHNPPVTMRRIVTMCCLDCGKRTRLLGFHQDWYGWRDTCLRCGRTWDGGEWLPLPFVRGSRQKAVAATKAHWRRTRGDVIRITPPAPTPGDAHE